MNQCFPSYGALAGYQFTPYIGAEFGYRRLGDVTVYSNQHYSSGDLNQAVLSVVGTLPLSNNFALTARYGRVKIYQGGDNLGEGNGALFGLGAQYAYTAAVKMRLEVQKPARGINNLSAALLYSF